MRVGLDELADDVDHRDALLGDRPGGVLGDWRAEGLEGDRDLDDIDGGAEPERDPVDLPHDRVGAAARGGGCELAVSCHAVDGIAPTPVVHIATG